MNPEQESELIDILGVLKSSPNDRAAWERLYLCLWPYVYGTVYAFVHGRKEMAEDVTQKVFIRLIQYCPFSDLKNPWAFRSYVSITAHNVARDALRKLLKSQEIPLENLPNIQDLQEASARPSLDEVELRDTLTRVLGGLTERDLHILRLHLEGSKLPEIAKKVGLKYGNVAVRLHRIKRRLRERLAHSSL